MKGLAPILASAALSIGTASCFTFVDFDLDDGKGGQGGEGGAGGANVANNSATSAGGEGGSVVVQCGSVDDCEGGTCEDGVCQGALVLEVPGSVMTLATGGDQVGWLTDAATDRVCVAPVAGAGHEPVCSIGAEDFLGTLAMDGNGVAYYAPRTEGLERPVLSCIPPEQCTPMKVFPERVAGHVNGLLVAENPSGDESLFAVSSSSGFVWRADLTNGDQADDEFHAEHRTAPVVGAHSLGFGANRFAISVFGDDTAPCVQIINASLPFDGTVQVSTCTHFAPSADRVTGLTVSPEGVVYTRVYSVANGGQTRTQVAGMDAFEELTADADSSAIASDANHVYFWAKKSGEPFRLWRCVHGGSANTDCKSLTPATNEHGRIALSDAYVFYSRGAEIYRAVKSP